MKKLLVVLVLLLGLLAVVATAVIVIMPRVTRLDPVKVAGDALTGYGANSDRHKNAQQLPTPWDPVGDANRRVEAIPVEDRAYPLIAEAAAMLEASNARDRLGSKPGEESWEDDAVWIRGAQAQAIIDLLRGAVSKPHSGFPLGDTHGQIWDDARERHGLERIGGKATKQPPMIGVLLPAISTSRMATRLLVADALVARESGDSEPFIDRIETAIQLTRLEYPLDALIQQLVHCANLAYVSSVVQESIVSSPGLMSESSALRAESALRDAMQRGVGVLETSGEMLFLEDQLRRYINGNGTFNGTAASAAAEALDTGQGTGAPSSVQTDAIDPDLLATLKEAQRLAGAGQAAARIVYKPMDDFEQAVESWAEEPDSIPGRMGRMTFGLMVPSWPRAVSVNRLFNQQMTALRLALAAHRHRLRHGDPPQGLADIDDDLITFDPVDGFTGGPMQFRWRDGAPFVYTYGPDRDDDGGRHVLDEDGDPWATISDDLLEASPDGDFVLFPTPGG